jgi:pyruvate kinase
MHIPGAEDRLQAFTPRDDEALQEAVAAGADLIGLSFVRSADDVLRVKSKVASVRPSAPGVVAKIETRSAVDNIEEIIEVADVVMIARGDLGIQLPFREVPLLQKDIIGACNRAGVPVITATQMLESMTHSLLPTRAEVNDVANAVIDGTDAVMLSEETAIGDYPAETVRVMSDIALEVEGRTRPTAVHASPGSDDPVSWAIARAAVSASEELHAAAILCPTQTGATARRVAAFRPSMPILALNPHVETLRQLAVVWGVIPLEVPFLRPEELSARGLERALTAARASGLGQRGDSVTMVAGGAAPRTASTDFVRILTL